MFGMFLKTKTDQKYIDFKKLVEVVVSCRTQAHCDVAFKYLQAYYSYHRIDRRLNPFVHMCALQLTEYLNDTNTHCVNGSHTPNWNGKSVVTTYPDINNYLKLGIRLKNH